ncbi:MAG: hypothetical protein ABI823_04165 [Bryobacteraceae bacterium]
MIQFDAPLQGIHAAETTLNKAAARIAGIGNPQDQVDLSAETLALLSAKYAVSANVAVAHTMDEVTKNLLDVLG